MIPVLLGIPANTCIAKKRGALSKMFTVAILELFVFSIQCALYHKKNPIKIV